MMTRELKNSMVTKAFELYQQTIIMSVHPSRVMHQNRAIQEYRMLSKLEYPHSRLGTLVCLQISPSIQSRYSTRDPQYQPSPHYLSPHIQLSPSTKGQSPLTGNSVVLHLQWIDPLHSDVPRITQIKNMNTAYTIKGIKLLID